jgi:hypothetical protein
MQYYEGDPNSFPETFLIPDDSDPPQAAVVNVANEALGDRTAYLKARLTELEAKLPRTKSQTFLADGTWTAPAGCTRAILIGCGGGGGGGGCRSSGTADLSLVPGAGGGGGAVEGVAIVEVVGGVTYSIAVGAGGASGANGNGTNNGGDGGYTQFIAPGAPPVVIAEFCGATGGLGSTSSYSSSTLLVIVPGGPALASSKAAERAEPFTWAAGTNVPFLAIATEGHGGNGGGPQGGGNLYLRRGAGSRRGYEGGVGGTHGNDAGNKAGGSPGGGGGAGPYGNGANGGNGGNANQSGAGANGANGQAAAANSGAGGGGGGSGGHGTTGSASGGTGGAGGSGRLTVIWIEE